MRLGSRYTHRMEVQLKKVNMNITSWRIALILRENGELSMTKVAEHAVGRLPTITKSVYRTQEQGWVKVSTNKDDARIAMVKITTSGLDIIEGVIENTSKIIDRAFEGFDNAQTDQLNASLQKILNNLSE